MNNTNKLPLRIVDQINAVVQSCIPVLMITVSGFTLFLLGFHVIPVFADKTPQLFSERTVQSELITQNPEGDYAQYAKAAAAAEAEKKTPMH